MNEIRELMDRITVSLQADPNYWLGVKLGSTPPRRLSTRKRSLDEGLLLDGEAEVIAQGIQLVPILKELEFKHDLSRKMLVPIFNRDVAIVDLFRGNFENALTTRAISRN